jgi:MerR family transcriptional regulator, aldehyde-responsive regulator
MSRRLDSEHTPTDKMARCRRDSPFYTQGAVLKGGIEIEPTFSIRELSERTGLSHDTIRYYEKIGLLPAPGRKPNGQRFYTAREVERFLFVTHLKRTHMPLKDIERYIRYSNGEDYENGYSVLHEHKLQVESQMAELLTTLDILNDKLDNFHSLIQRQIVRLRPIE